MSKINTQNINQIFEDALNDPSLLSTLDIDNLLESIENTKNDYLDNKTMSDITTEIQKNRLNIGHTTKSVYREMIKMGY